MTPLRMERTVQRYHGDPPVTISVELDRTEPWDVAMARQRLDKVARAYEDAAGCCGVPPGVAHHPDCVDAAEGLIELLRADAIAEGMEP